MTDEQLARNLRSVGMACYITYHDDLADITKTADSIISVLIEAEGYTPAASVTRVLKSRDIIRAGRDIDALKIIAAAPRVAPRVAEEALRILNAVTNLHATRLPEALSLNSGAGAKLGPRATLKMPVNHEETFAFIHSASVSELLALYAKTLDELRTRGVVRSANGPGGDYAELLCVRAFGWARAGNSAPGHDAVDTKNLKYQIKSRRIINSKTSRQLSSLRRLSDGFFDFLAGVLFESDYSVMRAAIIPHNIVVQRSRFSKHTNSSIFFLDDAVWQLPNVQDITAELRSAADELNSAKRSPS